MLKILAARSYIVFNQVISCLRAGYLGGEEDIVFSPLELTMWFVMLGGVSLAVF